MNHGSSIRERHSSLHFECEDFSDWGAMEASNDLRIKEGTIWERYWKGYETDFRLQSVLDED